MANSPPALRPSAHSRELARLIRARCDEPGFAPGGRLPTERRLADELGVTRTAVRHALAVLDAEHTISREVGRGTFLRSGGPRGGSSVSAELDLEADEVGPADVMAVRRLIEPRVLPLVVAWATQRDFDEMRRCVDGAAASSSYAEFEAWDFALHHAIVAAGRNKLLLSMYRVIERARNGELWGNLKSRSDSRERRARYHQDHVELVRALSAREVDQVVAIMEAHLARVEADLLGGPGRE